MNREQRRRNAKKSNMDVKDIDWVVQAAAREYIARGRNVLIGAAVDNIDAATLMVLHDKFGFGRERLNRFRAERYKTLGLLVDKRVTLEEVQAILKEEVYGGEDIPDEEMLLKKMSCIIEK